MKGLECQIKATCKVISNACFFFFFCVNQGLRVIQRTSIAYHGNLKSTNCLIDSRWTVKLADFGLREFSKPDQTKKSDDLNNSKGSFDITSLNAVVFRVTFYCVHRKNVVQMFMSIVVHISVLHHIIYNTFPMNFQYYDFLQRIYESGTYLNLYIAQISF